MKKQVLIIILSLFYTASFAQINALTESGDEVFLYEDGTWKYKKKRTEEKEIQLNHEKFSKSDECTFLVKSNILNVGIYINPDKWRFTKATSNTDAEFEFEMKGQDLYGVLITERVSIPVKSLRNIGVENARMNAPDLEVEKEEYRIINDTKVLMIQMSGTMQGLTFTYFGYYFSNDFGSVQLMVYTGKALFEEYREEAEKFINGFTEIEEE